VLGFRFRHRQSRRGLLADQKERGLPACHDCSSCCRFKTQHSKCSQVPRCVSIVANDWSSDPPSCRGLLSHSDHCRRWSIDALWFRSQITDKFALSLWSVFPVSGLSGRSLYTCCMEANRLVSRRCTFVCGVLTRWSRAKLVRPSCRCA